MHVIIVHACIMTIAYACIMIIAHVSYPTWLIFGEIESGWSGGRRFQGSKEVGLGGASPPMQNKIVSNGSPKKQRGLGGVRHLERMKGSLEMPYRAPIGGPLTRNNLAFAFLVVE